jgi:pyruvate,water dikinase
MVNSLLENDKDIQEIEAEKRRQQKGLTKKVLQKIGAQKYGFLKKQIFKIILFYAQMYIGFRENQRFFLDHQNFRFRKVFLEMGNRLAERKILKERDDVFFLYKEEVFDGLKSGNINNELLKKRKKDFNQYERKLPPKFLQGTTEFDQEFQYEKELSGTASSPGVVTGAVRLIKSIDELCTIKKGEILVAQCTDPGWTPIFVKIKGLITETGGMLSHGAVISREYGIPAVTGVKNALKILEMGDIIVLDGNIGKIYIR